MLRRAPGPVRARTRADVHDPVEQCGGVNAGPAGERAFRIYSGWYEHAPRLQVGRLCVARCACTPCNP